MAQQILNPNSVSKNDGLGDKPWDYTAKINDNFTEIYGSIGGLGNVIEVNSIDDLITAPETRIKFKANTRYVFGEKVTHAYEADFESGASLSGPSQLVNIYEYTGSGTAFSCEANAGVELVNFGFSVPNGTIFNLNNPLPLIMNFIRCFECDRVGSISGGGSLSAVNFFDSAFLNIKTQGFQLSDDFLILSLREVFLFTSATGVNLIDWSGTNITSLEITNIEAQAPSGSFVLYGDAGSVNIAAGRVASIRDSNLSTKAIGNSLGGGLDENDAGYFFDKSVVKDSKPVGHCYIASGDELLTNLTAGVETPIAGTFTQGPRSSQSTSSALGYITMNNRVGVSATVSASLDVDKSGGGNDDYLFKIKKIPVETGVAEDVEGAFTTKTMGGGDTDAFNIFGPSEFAEGDQYYIAVTAIGTNDDITVNTQGFMVNT